MEIYQIAASRLALRSLGNMQCFVAGQRLDVEAKETEGGSKYGNIIGIYVNGKENYLVITELGIRVFRGTRVDFIEYADITQVTLPQKDDRDLDLLLENDRFDDVRSYAIPILGVTGDTPDIFNFYEFLAAMLEKTEISPINLMSIACRQDLVDYLKTECEWEEYTDALANYLERDFDPDSFDALNIDKTLLEHPDFWKAIAVILNVPITAPVELVREPEWFADQFGLDK